MKIAIVGATGNVGRSIVAEALRRGHSVTAIARQIGALPAAKNLREATGDVADPAALAATLSGHDVVVSAVRFSGTDPQNLIAAVRQSGVERYAVVGGAGSLTVASGETLLASGGVPEIARAESEAGQLFLDALRAVRDLDWTMLSPAAMFWPGDRTGTFRIGADELLIGYDGKSRISYDDFSIALLDEIEQPEHHCRRFTVGY